VNTVLWSDFDTARLEHPDLDDAALVRLLADQTVRELELTPPVDPNLVASYRGIARIEEVDQPWAGCLTHDNNETVARVRASDGRHRRRFTALHEVKHTYLPGYTLTQYRCNPAPRSRASKPMKDRFEALADIGASELLFPRDHFLADLAGNPLTLDLVEEFSARYDASLEATGITAVDLAPTDAALICLEPATKPSQPDAEPVLRVRWTWTAGDWPHIPKHKSAPDGGQLHRALLGEVVNETGTLVGLTREPLDRLRISSRLYPYTTPGGATHRRVLALLTSTTGSRHAT
jgi:hypothetical protein